MVNSSDQSVAVYLFGSPRIERAGSPVQADTRKAVALLAFLAVTGIPHSRESLISLLYPELDQTHARAALRRTISAMKQVVGSVSLVVSGENLALGNLWVDVRDFSQRLEFWKTHAHPDDLWCEECHTRLEEAARLYGGDFMAGFTLRDSLNFDDWQYFQTESYKKDLMAAYSQLVAWLSMMNKYEKAIEYARHWLSLDVLNEEAHRSLMRCYAWSGQHGAALRQYRECVRILDRELGVTPVEDTSQLYRAIMEHRLPAQPVIAIQSRLPSPHLNLPGPRKLEPKPGEIPLVGRSQELEELRWAYQWSATRGCFYLLEGEMGIGKSRLAREFIDSIEPENKPVLSARCFDGELQLAYAPFIEALQPLAAHPAAWQRINELPQPWLSQAARLLPEFHPASTDRPDSQNAPLPSQSVLFESLRRLILSLAGANPPVVIFLDDLQWADAASLDFLAFLVRRLDLQPMFILGTWRDEGSPADLRLRQIFAEAQRYGTGKILHLDRLSQDLVQQMVEAVINPVDGPHYELTRRLYAETEGVPFLAVEYLNRLAADSRELDNLSERADGWVLPDNVRDALQARLSTISEIGWQLLTTGAVLGRSFDYKNLVEASGRTEYETVTGLEELIRRQVIKERRAAGLAGELTYDFSHEKIRQLVYEQASLSRRRLMHRRVAEVLASQGRGGRQSGAGASAIAQHFELAGELNQAAEYYRQAGVHASAVFAHREAVANFQAALTFGHPGKTELHEAIGDSLVRLGDYRAASDSYEAAIAFCLPHEVPRFELKLGNIHHRLGDYQLAMCYFESAARALQSGGDPGLLARIYADWSRSAFFLHDHEKARQLAAESLNQAHNAGDPRAIAQVHNILGILARHVGQYDISETELNRSLQVARQLNESALILTALNNLALLHVHMGNLPEAVKHTQTALELSERLGDRHLEAALHNNLADILHTQGESDLAMEELKKAVVIFSEIGVQQGEIVPEVWKLTEW